MFAKSSLSAGEKQICFIDTSTSLDIVTDTLVLKKIEILSKEIATYRMMEKDIT